MTIEELKELYLKGEMDLLYTCKIDGKDSTIMVVENGFCISIPTKPKWARFEYYEFIDGQWYKSTTYKHEKDW